MESDEYIVKWIHNNFSSPHCSKVKQICDLQSGVAIAEMLTQTLPQDYQTLLLSKIQVNNLNSNTCIKNFKIIKSVLSAYCSDLNISNFVMVSHYMPQNLYYRETDLKKFVHSAVFKIWQFNSKNNKIIMSDNVSKQLKTYQSRENNSININGRDVNYCNTISAHLLPKSQQKASSYYRSNGKLNPQRQSKINTNNENINVSQLSDIINCSNLQNANYFNMYGNDERDRIINSKNTNVSMNINTNAYTQYDQNYQTNYQSEVNKQNQLEEEQQQFKVVRHISQQQIAILEEWVTSKLGVCPIEQPHRLLGQLVNSIFCSSRLNDYIIKDAHFEHGPIFVYRKALQFLLTHTLADKVNKNNILFMLKSVQEEGVLRETQFWTVIKDIYQYDLNKRKYHRSRNNSHHNTSKNKQSKKLQQNKQNINNINNIKKQQSVKSLSKCKTSKQTLLQNANENRESKQEVKSKLIYNKTDNKQVQDWINKQLGYEHSLTKSKNPCLAIYDNSLLNGTLIASILMRFKVGKPILNKLPTNSAQVRNNWEQINKVCTLRGYQSFKKILYHLQQFDKYDRIDFIGFCLAAVKNFKDQYFRKNPIVKNKDQSTYRSVKQQTKQQCNNCVWNNKEKKNINIANNISMNQQKQQIKQWLFKNHSIQIPSSQSPPQCKSQPQYPQYLFLSTSQLTQICRNLLNINIYKQTTQRIQVNNVQKILGELRRIGLSDYYLVSKQEVMKNQREGEDLRWKILWDLKWVIDGKVQFCHA